MFSDVCNLTPKKDLLFGRFLRNISLGPPFAKSQKVRDLGVLAKFAITRFSLHLWSRFLQQNVLRCLHFKCILFTCLCDLRRGFFQAPKVAGKFLRFCMTTFVEKVVYWHVFQSKCGYLKEDFLPVKSSFEPNTKIVLSKKLFTCFWIEW